jgi:polyhydroxyalkanoate synthase
MNRCAPLTETPHDVVYQDGSLRLLRYVQPEVSPGRFAEPVVICFALVNRPYILDLLPQRSVVRQLLRAGLDVYLIDWGAPRTEDCMRRLQDYVGGSIREAVDVACRHGDATQVSLLGYCMGGTMAVMFASLYPERIRNLILLAAPIDFAGSEGLLNVWTQEQYFDVDGLIAAFGNCPGEFLRCVIQMMRPVDNFFGKQLQWLESVSDPTSREFFARLEQWAQDSIPVAGETFREFVVNLYRRNELVHGALRLNDELVDPRRITCPLLMLVADNDHLVPPRATLALQGYVGSQEIKQIRIDTGHVGLAVSSKAHGRLWPEAARWIADHSTRRSTPREAIS